MLHSQNFKQSRAARPRYVQWLVLAVAAIILSLLSGRAFSAEAATSAPITIIVDNVVQVESDSGTSDFVFTVSLSEAADDIVTMDARTEESEFAVAGDDFTAFSDQEITFPVGSTEQELTVSVIGEELVENDEAFSVVLSNAQIGGVIDASALSIADDTGVGTITNDDAATVSIADLQVTETDSGVFIVNALITLDKPVDTAIQVSVRTQDDTALSTHDYSTLANPVNLTFPAGAGHVENMSIGIIGDTIVEADETFDVSLFDLVTGGLDVTLGQSEAMVTIIENDSATLAINDVTIVEGDAGTTQALFTVTLSGDVSTSFVVPYSTTDGTATDADGDYVTKSGSLNFDGDDGETKQIAVTINGDSMVEASEQFSVTLSAPSAGGLNVSNSDGVGVGTITADDTGTITLSGDNALLEGDSGSNSAEYTITLSDNIADFTLDFATQDGTALSGSDFDSHSETLSFTSSGALSQTVTVNVTSDEMVELDELFSAVISNTVFADPDTADFVTIDVASVDTTITNDDEASLSISDGSLVEGDSGTAMMEFTVTLSSAADETVSVSVNGNDDLAEAGSDYEAISGMTVTFNPGDALTKIVQVEIIGDTTIERDETFNVQLANVLFDGAPTAIVTIADAIGIGLIDNDDFVEIAIGDATANEADGQIEFVLTLSDVSAETITLTLNTNSDGPTGSGFTPITDGFIVIPAGASSYTLTVPIANDSSDGPDVTYTVELSDPINAILLDGTATAVVADNDSEPTVTVFDLFVDEASATASITAMLSQYSGYDVTLNYLISDNTAVRPDDYTGASGQIIIPAGAVGATIEVNLVDDSIYEGLELFNVEITQATHALLGDVSSTVVIADDEAMPTLFVNDVMGAEADGSVTFTVSLATESALDVTVNYALVDGSAESPGDYTATNGTLVFPAGTTSQQVVVAIINDDYDEDNETFTIELSDPINATVGSRAVLTVLNAVATATIIDDDTVGIQIVNPHGGQPLQEGGTQTVTITLDSAPTSPVTVTLVASPPGVCDVTSPIIIDESNWDTGVPVTISAIQDNVDNGDQACTVEIETIVSVDPGYNNPPLTLPTIDVTVENRDPVSIVGGLSYSTPFGQELIVNEPGVLAGSPATVPVTVTLVGEPEHGALVMNPDGSFSFLPSADFVDTDTFTYTVTDGYSTVTETATIVGFQVGPNVADTGLANPDSSTTLSYLDEVNNETSITIPAGAVTETMTVILERLPAGPPNALPSGLVSADETFNFDAYPNGALTEPFVFESPVTVTIEYDDDDVQGLIEGELEIRYWDLDAQVWVDAATTCEPTTSYTRDLVNNTISIQVCQTGEFTLVGVRVPTAVSVSNSAAAPAASGTWQLPLLALLLTVMSGVIVSKQSALRRQPLHF